MSSQLQVSVNEKIVRYRLPLLMSLNYIYIIYISFALYTAAIIVVPSSRIIEYLGRSCLKMISQSSADTGWENERSLPLYTLNWPKGPNPPLSDFLTKGRENYSISCLPSENSLCAHFQLKWFCKFWLKLLPKECQRNEFGPFHSQSSSTSKFKLLARICWVDINCNFSSSIEKKK